MNQNIPKIYFVWCYIKENLNLVALKFDMVQFYNDKCDAIVYLFGFCILYMEYN